MPLLGQQIIGKQPIAERRKHIPTETVFSVGAPRRYITRTPSQLRRNERVSGEEI
jgi:hypothetical protein